MGYYYICNGDVLYHHGIKGQKWGVRRFQKKDGSLTPAGKERYNDDETSNISRKEARLTKYADRYKAMGYSDEEANRMAKGRDKTIKTLAAIGTLTVAAVVASSVYRKYDGKKDLLIPAEATIQTVHKGDIKDRVKEGNPFYASFTKKDNHIYSSKAFDNFDENSKISKIFTKDGIKVASHDNSKKIFNELMEEDKEFNKYVKEHLRIGNKGKKTYESFQADLQIRDEVRDKMNKRFYDKLRENGYGAMIDSLDSRKIAMASKPVIIFDESKKHIIGTTKASEKDLSYDKEFIGNVYGIMRRFAVKPATSITASAVIGQKYLSDYVNTYNTKDYKKQNTIIKQYRQEHPNTELTDKEILDILNKGE